MSVEDFRDSFTSYTVTYLHDNWKNSFIEKRNAVTKKAYKFNFSITDDLFDDSLAQRSGLVQIAGKKGHQMPPNAKFIQVSEEAEDEPDDDGEDEDDDI